MNHPLPTVEFLAVDKIRQGSIDSWATTTTHAKRPNVPGRHLAPKLAKPLLGTPKVKVTPINYPHQFVMPPTETVRRSRDDRPSPDSISRFMNALLTTNGREDNTLHDATVTYIITH